MARARTFTKSMLGAAALTTMLAGPATAQEYPVQNGTLDATDSNNDGVVGANEAITVSGGGYAPGAEVQITVGSVPTVLGTTIANSAGEISTSVVLPATLSDGTHTLNASGANASGGVLVLGVQVTNAAQSGSASTTTTTTRTTTTQATTATTRATNTGNAGAVNNNNQLAFTGVETNTLVAGGLSLLVAGGALVAYRKRSLSES